MMAAVRSPNAGNPRAKKLEGENLLIEFHWCAAYAVRLGQFAAMLAPAMASPDHYEWPERPKIPSRADVSGVSRAYRSGDEAILKTKRETRSTPC
jgi:hypothetical protein